LHINPINRDLLLVMTSGLFVAMAIMAVVAMVMGRT
jgi:hypothetical protein